MALVSVVIPAYNAERTLAEAIQSILDQTYSPLEVVVVDDGSTDGTEAVARRFGAPVRYVRQKNAGPSAARNTGLAQARGEYVTFVDSDDAFRPERVAVLVKALRQASPAAVFAATDGWLWDGEQYVHRFTLSHPTPGERSLTDFLDYNRTIVGILARRSVLLDVGGFQPDLWRSEDYHLWIRLLAAGHTYVYVPEPLYLYRLQLGTLSRNEELLRQDACRVHQEALRTLPLTWGERRRIAYLLWRDRGNLHATAARAALNHGERLEWARRRAASVTCQGIRTLLRPHFSLQRLTGGDACRRAAFQALDTLQEKN